MHYRSYRMHMLYNVNGSLRSKLFRGRLGGGREILNPFLQKDTLQPDLEHCLSLTSSQSKIYHLVSDIRMLLPNGSNHREGKCCFHSKQNQNKAKHNNSKNTYSKLKQSLTTSSGFPDTTQTAEKSECIPSTKIGTLLISFSLSAVPSILETLVSEQSSSKPEHLHDLKGVLKHDCHIIFTLPEEGLSEPNPIS